MPSPPFDPAQLYADMAAFISFLEPGEVVIRAQVAVRFKSGRVALHTIPIVQRDKDGLSEFQRKCLEVAARSPVPMKRAALVKSATAGRGKATGRYGTEVAELVTLGKLRVCHRVYVTDDPAKCGREQT